MSTDSLGGVSKLTIIPLKENMTPKSSSPDPDDSQKIECQFNPESMQYNKTFEWAFRTDIGSNVPEPVFAGGKAGIFSVNLLFDSTDTGDDVRDKFVKLMEVAKIKPSNNPDAKGEPRQMLLQWGDFISFVVIVESINTTFNLFTESGTPLRAQVTVTFREAVDSQDKAPMNPTSRTDARRTWIVEKGQRLDWIAYRVYGDTSAWRHIAETNQILDPLAVRPGQILKLTPLA
jgi:hypothetical protein